MFERFVRSSATVPSALRSAWTFSWTMGMAAAAVGHQLLSPSREAFAAYTDFWASQMVKSCGWEVRVFGREHLEPGAQYVYLANHQSQTDIPVLFVSLPEIPGFLAKAELRSVPIFGRAMLHGGHVFVERSKHSRAVEAIAAAAVQMKEHGGSIVVFPEGTRSERAEIKVLKKGGFHLAREAGVPIVPVGIRGSRFLMPKHGRLVRSGRVEVRIGEPMRVEAEHGPELDRLVEEVRLRLSELALLPLAAPQTGPRIGPRTGPQPVSDRGARA